ncbi:MAG: hypothetical protein KUL78_10025 [Flavobacterium sp.]|nr:hypothetical protein [Flavobacterium sp.]
MKIYYFIAAVAVCAFFVSCSNDDQENLYQNEIQQPNTEGLLVKEGDSLVQGIPVPPKPKG